MRDPYNVGGKWYFYRNNRQFGPYSTEQRALEVLDFYNNYSNNGECAS